MVLQNRVEAARLLLKKLKKYEGKRPLILGIPRGAMPMAAVIAEGLQGELNAILIHKIPAPHQEELAIGSVGLSGEIYRLPLIKALGVSEAYLKEAAQIQVEVLKKRQEKFNLPPLDCRGRIVIIVDDGIATGATALGAIHEVRAQKPQKIILAAGVIASSSLAEIRPLVDELIVLDAPEFFYAVSQFFVDFKQVTDEEVIQLIDQYQKKTGSLSSPPPF